MDYDVHRSNSTMHSFYESSRLVSLAAHQWPAFLLSRADAPYGALRAVQSSDEVILVSKEGGNA